MSSPETDPTSTCARCKKEIAEGERVEHRGTVYCMDCVGKMLNGEAHRWASLRADLHVAWQEALNWLSVRRETGYRNPTLAVILSLLPGLGQMYNGQMRKGVVLLGGFLVLATGGFQPILGPLLHTASIAALYFWNLFDAYWTAQRINGGEMGEQVPVVPVREQPVQPQQPAVAVPAAQVAPMQETVEKRREQPSGALAGWGVFLIILGALFLLNNIGIAWLTSRRIWPTALLALGIWLLISFALSRREPPSTQPPSEEEQNV